MKLFEKRIFFLFNLCLRFLTVARIVGTPKAATGLSEAREAAGAIAESRIACFLIAERSRSKQKATQKKRIKNKNGANNLQKFYWMLIVTRFLL